MEKKEIEEEKKDNKVKKDKKENASDNEEEDPKLEKPSYTYWKRDSDKAADHTQFHPQPAAPIKESQPQVNKITSCWNKAGTWEEKKLNKAQVEDYFNGKMKETPFIYKEAFKLDKIHSYSGDTYFVSSRGKIKFIYDCEMQLDVVGVGECEGGKATVTIKEISNADLDEDFEFEFDSVTKKEGNKKYRITEIFKANKKSVQNDIRKIFDDLKESMLK